MPINSEWLSLFLIFIAMYAFISYVYYRLLAKFDQNISFWQIFIPVWGMYLLAKQITARPALYVAALYLSAILVPAVQTHYWLILSLQLIQGLLLGNIFGQFAKRLGKNYWFHAILGFFWLPVLVTAPIMAFDSSQPKKTNAANSLT